jgi:hypothetical protein
MKKEILYLIGGAVIGASAMAFTTGPILQAQAPRKCDYTYIRDRQFPSLGENGKVEYNDTWRSVVDQGWTLKLWFEGGYVFEKCQ